MTSLEECRQRGDVIQNMKNSEWFQRYFKDQGLETRLSSNSVNLRLKPFRTDLRRHFYGVRVPKIWNNIFKKYIFSHW